MALIQARTLGTRSGITSRRCNPVIARRTVLGRPGATNGRANTVLEEPNRLWEIGSSYWLPFAGFSPPAYLDGTLPGDRGFDPLRLAATWGAPPGVEDASSEQRLRWLLEAELYHGRLTMLAVVGVLAVDLQGKGPWWTAPYTYDWPSIGSAGATFAVGVVAFHTVIALLEKARIENFAEKGEAGHFGAAPFDPLQLVDDYKRQAEIRNGRLAMLSFLGFAVQAWVTGLGPIECAQAHLADPFGANVFTYGDKGLQVVAWFMAASVGVHLAEINNNRK